VGYGLPDGIQDNTFGNNVADWISFWTSNNNCGSVTLEGQFPDISNDGFTVEYVEYAGCNGNSRVVHYKVNGADHTWLGPNDDVFYTREIWKFFLGLSPSNLVPAGVNDNEIGTIGIYPNPSTDIIRLENVDAKILNASVFNTNGQLVKQFSTTVNAFDISELQAGVYQLMVATEKGIFSNSFIKQ
jgi:hypothetical protein